jgi:hypothetical protein
MPDLMALLQAVVVATVVAAGILLFCGYPWRTPRPVQAAAGGVLGVGVAFLIGCWLVGARPHWPPQEDQDRLLFLVFPAVAGIELLAALADRFGWLAWLLRLGIAAATARVLLHNTIYLADLAGPGSREWSPTQAWLILGGLAGALAAVWAGLVALARRPAGRSVPLALAIACAGAALSIMFSGYTTGGQIGLPLAGAVAGAALASLALAEKPASDGLVGLGVVGLFALLVLGRFFGQLTTGNACLLFLAPLLCWLPELPYARRLGPRLRGISAVALAAVPVAMALMLAQQKFVEQSKQTSPGTREPSLQDYMDYGK